MFFQLRAKTRRWWALHLTHKIDLGEKHSVVRSGSRDLGGDREFDRLRHCLFGFCGCGANDKCASRSGSKECGAVSFEMIRELYLPLPCHFDMQACSIQRAKMIGINRQTKMKSHMYSGSTASFSSTSHRNRAF